jgi:Zn-dependent protease
VELESLLQQAKLAGQAGDWPAARLYWQRALELMPAGSPEYHTATERIENIDAQIARSHGTNNSLVKWTTRLGPLALLFSKAKFLIFGLGKLTTLLSMLASFGLYWTMYGWRFAAGLVLSIYVHEMGHVHCLRKYGIAATAPMFIPGFGAVVMLKQHLSSAYEEARVGLAGPIWGLGAAVACWLAALVTGQHVFYALAHTGAWINLFNLIPVWQLDGGRAMRALTRQQRGIALVTVLVMWALTEDSMLLFIALGLTYRLFSRDYAEEPDNGALTLYAGLIVLLGFLVVLSKRPFLAF